MVQDIAPKKLYNEYRIQKLTEADYIAIFSRNQILIKESDGHMELPTLSDLPCDMGDSIYIFCIDESRYFLYPNMPPGILNITGTPLHFYRISDIRYRAGQELCFAAYTAYHLCQWYRANRFCGCCGAPTKVGTEERMLHCVQCGNQIYPRISPAVIVAVTNGDKILLTKYANREYQRYALIAGYTEIGETAEGTVRREVMEEAGLSVKNIRYYKSQPWGIDGNLLLGYFAELDGSDQISIDGHELASAEWVSRELLKDMDDSFSLTREMMRVFYESAAHR